MSIDLSFFYKTISKNIVIYIALWLSTYVIYFTLLIFYKKIALLFMD